MNQFAIELARSAFFIDFDSGPGHVAAAVGTPTLTLISNQMVTRYATLGPAAPLPRYSGGIRTVTAERVMQAGLAHPQFGECHTLVTSAIA